MKNARISGRFPVACALLAVLTGCETGTGKLQSYFDQVNQTDALVFVGAVVGAVMYSNANPDFAWKASVTEAGTGRYRISIARAAWTGTGEGEFSGRFGREAEKVAAEHSCKRFKVLSYNERYQSQNLGSQKVGEGVIQCD